MVLPSTTIRKSENSGLLIREAMLATKFSFDSSFSADSSNRPMSRMYMSDNQRVPLKPANINSLRDEMRQAVWRWRPGGEFSGSMG